MTFRVAFRYITSVPKDVVWAQFSRVSVFHLGVASAYNHTCVTGPNCGHESSRYTDVWGVEYKRDCNPGSSSDVITVVLVKMVQSVSQRFVSTVSGDTHMTLAVTDHGSPHCSQLLCQQLWHPYIPQVIHIGQHITRIYILSSQPPCDAVNTAEYLFSQDSFFMSDLSST